MLVVTATHSGDIAEAIRLYKWIKRLGLLKEHSCLLIIDPATPFDKSIELRVLAEEIFKTALLATLDVHVEGWPDAPNQAFQKAAEIISDSKTEWHRPFLWLEPDTVPMRPGWLDEIELVYEACGSRYMGHIYQSEDRHRLAPYFSGIAVYPPDCASELVFKSNQAWDVVNADLILGLAHNTPLIHHRWGTPDRPPEFVEGEWSGSVPPFPIPFGWLPKECALFHRDKSGSLMRILEKRLGLPREVLPIKVVFNVHNGDLPLALIHARWLTMLCQGRKWRHEAIIAHDPSANMIQLNQLQASLNQSFESVSSLVYPMPPIPTYPHCANWAWSSIAVKMLEQENPWLFFEADAIALKPDWITQLQQEYERGKKSFMGAVVQHMGHLNGSAVYPHDAARRMPRAMAAMEQAWDMVAKQEIGGDTHDASHLMHHVWTLVNRKSYPVGGGELPVGITPAELQSWLPQSAVFLHRVKDDSVLRALINGQFRNF